METTIYLIRHSEQLRIKGEVFSKDSSQIKNEKIPLSINGEFLAQNLSNMEELKNIDVLFSSSYVRAISTAKYIAKRNNIEINIDERLRRTQITEI